MDGVLKQSIQFLITVLSVVQEVPTFGLGLIDAVTEKIAGFSVGFELMVLCPRKRVDEMILNLPSEFFGSWRE